MVQFKQQMDTYGRASTGCSLPATRYCMGVIKKNYLPRMATALSFEIIPFSAFPPNLERLHKGHISRSSLAL